MKKDLLPLGVRVLLGQVGSLAALILIFVIGLKVGLGQVDQRRSNLTSLQKNKEILTAKRDLLTNIAPQVASQAGLVTAALPGRNPALLVISQIKKLAVAKGIAITGLKVGASAETKSKAAAVEVSLDLVGPVVSVFDLINGIKKIAPISHIDKVELNLSGTDVQSSLQVKAYWAPFPTKLPALTQPISGLTKAEETLLETLADLTLPAFVTLAPSGPVENPNPFGE